MGPSHAGVLLLTLFALGACADVSGLSGLTEVSDAASSDATVIDAVTADAAVGDGSLDAPSDVPVAVAPPQLDASGPDVIDAAVLDAAPLDPGIRCNGGNTFCTPAPQVCCVQSVQTSQSQCAASATDCQNQGDIPVACQDRAQCPANHVCCGQKVDPATYSDVSCQSSCLGSLNTLFCDPTITPNECASTGRTCTASSILPGYYVCL